MILSLDNFQLRFTSTAAWKGCRQKLETVKSTLPLMNRHTYGHCINKCLYLFNKHYFQSIAIFLQMCVYILLVCMYTSGLIHSFALVLSKSIGSHIIRNMEQDFSSGFPLAQVHLWISWNLDSNNHQRKVQRPRFLMHPITQYTYRQNHSRQIRTVRYCVCMYVQYVCM